MSNVEYLWLKVGESVSCQTRLFSKLCSRQMSWNWS